MQMAFSFYFFSFTVYENIHLATNIITLSQALATVFRYCLLLFVTWQTMTVDLSSYVTPSCYCNYCFTPSLLLSFLTPSFSRCLSSSISIYRCSLASPHQYHYYHNTQVVLVSFVLIPTLKVVVKITIC